MATQQERELLALLAEERRRNASAEQQPQAAVSLPNLTPEMLLSPAARREVEAAQGWSGRPVAQATSERRPSRRDETFEVTSADNDMGEIDLDAGWEAAPSVTDNDDQVLSSLFMGREAQEAQAVLGGDYSGGGGSRHGFDIEFDADTMLEGRTTPNESARWQVGRQSPPQSRFAYEAARPLSGPSDGVVVSRRGDDGAWERRASASQPAIPQAEPRPGLASIRPQGAQARPPTASPAPPRANPNVYRPTVYERIMQQSVLGDDD